MKTPIIILVVAITIIGIVLGLIAYSYTQIQFSLKDVSYKSLDFATPSASMILKLAADFLTGNWLEATLTLVTGVKLGLVFSLANHGLFPVYIPDVSYDIFVNGVNVGKGQSRIDATINPGESRDFPDNIEDVQFESIQPAISSIVSNNGNVDFKVSGTAYFNFLGISVPIPFQGTKQINVYDEIKNRINSYISQSRNLPQSYQGIQANTNQQNPQQTNSNQGATSVPCPVSEISHLPQTQSISYTFVQSTINPTSPSITMSIDKTSYTLGDTIVISGQVQSIVVGTPLTIQILDSNNNLVQVAQIDVSQDGKYTDTIKAVGSLWKSNGVYTVKVQYGPPNVTAQSAFTFQSTIVQTSNVFHVQTPYTHQTLDVNYMISGGNVSLMTIDAQSLSVSVSIDSTSGGTITLQLPRALIDSRTIDCQDDNFIVLIDGAEIKPQSESSDNHFRNITVQFLQGDKEIQIIGTQISH